MPPAQPRVAAGGPGQQPEYGPSKRGISRLISRLMRGFFYLIYQPMAWSYDLVAWSVSLGRWKDWVLSALPYLGAGPVLELGHGPGYLQTALAEGGILAFGMDASPQMGRLAQRRLRKLGYAQRLARGLAQSLPFPNGSFASIASTFPSEYIVHPDTLAEVRRLLAPDGSLVIAPLAWITGQSLPDQAARWLFRITGEAPAWDERWLQPFVAAGFDLHHQELVEIRHSRVLVLIFKVRRN